MKIVSISTGTRKPIGLKKALEGSLVEQVTGNSADEIQSDVQQFLETWDPDLLVFVEIEPKFHNIQATAIIKSLRRANTSKHPIIFVGNLSEDVAVQALASGAQAVIPVLLDHETSKYSVNSDFLRLQAASLVNLSKGQAGKDFRLGDIVVFRDTQEIYIGNDKISLSPYENTLLMALILAKGRVVSKERLYMDLYGYESNAEIKIIDVFICKIRKHLEEFLAPIGYDGEKIIKTALGRGYHIELSAIPGISDRRRASLLFGEAQGLINDANHPDLRVVPVSREPRLLESFVLGKSEVLQGTHAPHRKAAEPDILQQIHMHLMQSDFQLTDADALHYVDLATKAVAEGHSVSSLFRHFGGYFMPVWQRRAPLDEKTFEYHLNHPERLRFYRLNPKLADDSQNERSDPQRQSLQCALRDIKNGTTPK